MKRGGLSGERSRDLRIKRPSVNTGKLPNVQGEYCTNSDAKSTGEPRFPSDPTKADNPGGAGPCGQLQKPDPHFCNTLAPGVRVQVLKGLAAGLVATITERWPRNIGGVPAWVLVSDDLVRKRVLRADYLRAVT